MPSDNDPTLDASQPQEEGGPSGEERRLFELLNDYVQRLHEGEPPERESFSGQDREVLSALDCLDVLESFAPLADDAPPAEAVPAAATGEFGPYDLLEEIGRGGMGVVFKARQRSLDRVVAVKMILASQLARPEHVRRFHAEAKAAAGLRHPNIVSIFDAGEVQGQHYFAMDFVTGSSLAEILLEEPVDPEQAARWLLDVARAVDHLHRHNVVHRDLKPSNILIDEDGCPHVTDFGLAKVFSDQSQLTHTGAIVGTPSYMAPEQAAGRPSEVGPASDVYSLGAILYELLTGRPPFREENPLDTLVQVLEREPELPRQSNPRVPRALELICLRCLEKSPRDRYPSAAALAEDLERFLQGETVEARPPQLVQRVWRWARRKPALALRLAALVGLYPVELANYIGGKVDAAFHWQSTAILALWLSASFVYQRYLDSPRWGETARYAWAVTDTAILTALLLVADGIASPLMVVYPLLIAASGLWFRVRLVTMTTALSVASYLLLLADAYLWRPRLAETDAARWDGHAFFLVMLVVLGGAIGYQVHRIRCLTRYYEARRTG